MEGLSVAARDMSLTPDDIDFARYMQETENGTKVRPIADWANALIEEIRSGNIGGHGACLPWEKTTHDVRLRPGEMSIWAGVNGHGKSLMLGQIMQSLAAQRERSVICSFEMKPVNLLRRLVRQAAGCADFTESAVERWAAWARDWIYLYDQRGQTPPEMVYAVARYAAEELGARHFVVDSMMKVVASEKEMDPQKAFIDKLFTIAQDTGLHVHLVHHMRKGEDEYRAGGKFDLKGSGAISDMVDNVFIVWKNKKKMSDREAGKEIDEAEPDALLIVEKQRNGEYEGKFAFWFHAPSQQFVPTPESSAMPIIPAHAEAA